MRGVIAVCAAMLFAACSAGPPAPIELGQRIAPPGAPAFDLRLLLQPEHRHDGDRYLRAAVATMTMCDDWLGAFPRGSLTLVDPPWRSPATVPAGAVLMDRTPWWSARTSMLPELAAARAVSRQFMRERIDTSALPPWFVDGLAEYAARRGMLPLFEADNTAPGYAFLEQRYLHEFIPRFVRIRLLIETDGEPVTSFRAHGGVAVSAPPRSATDARSLAGKTLLALGTLERWLGRPVFDEVIAEFVQRSGGGRPTLEQFSQIATSVSGQNLSWLFDEVFGSARIFDYGIGLLQSERGADGAFETVVVARRIGDARFTGANAAPVGPFESGRGIKTRVVFEDGREVTDAWDGRGAEKVFRYRSPTRAVSALVDPDRVLLLDLQQTNNGVTLSPHAGAAASRWSLLWLAWLEHAMITYSALL
jgi:hypothetical protein